MQWNSQQPNTLHKQVLFGHEEKNAQGVWVALTILYKPRLHHQDGLSSGHRQSTNGGTLLATRAECQGESWAAARAYWLAPNRRQTFHWRASLTKRLLSATMVFLSSPFFISLSNRIPLESQGPYCVTDFANEAGITDSTLPKAYPYLPQTEQSCHNWKLSNRSLIYYNWQGRMVTGAH